MQDLTRSEFYNFSPISCHPFLEVTKCFSPTTLTVITISLHSGILAYGNILQDSLRTTVG